MNVPKLRFKEFNDEYNALKLSDVAELTSSKRIYLSDYTDNGIPFYRGKEISELKLNKPVSDLLYISDEKYKEIEAKYGVPKENDILVTGVGTLGNIYRIPNNNKFYFKDGNLIWLKNIKQNSEYLEYNLEFNKKKLLDSAIGSTQKALTIAGLNKLSFYYPSTSEQTKVARTMQLIDIKINLQSKKIEDLKLFKKGLNKNIFSNFNAKYKIDELIKEYNQKTSKNNQFEVLSSTANGIILQNEYFNKQAASLDNTGYKIVPFGFITYRSMSDTGEFHFNIQNITENGIVSPAYPVFEINENIVDKTYFIYYINENKSFKNKILSLKEGGTRYALSMSKFKEINLDLPPLEYQKKYSKLLNTYNRKIKNEENKLNKLQELKKGLMQNMFV